MLNHKGEWVKQPSEHGGNEESLLKKIEELNEEIRQLRTDVNNLIWEIIPEGKPEPPKPEEDVVIKENAISFPEETIEIKEETNSLILNDNDSSEIIENTLVLID